MPEFMKSACLSLKAYPVPGSDMLSQLILTIVLQDRHYYPYFADNERRAHKVLRVLPGAYTQFLAELGSRVQRHYGRLSGKWGMTRFRAPLGRPLTVGPWAHLTCYIPLNWTCVVTSVACKEC